jgi:hypothetical protein
MSRIRALAAVVVTGTVRRKCYRLPAVAPYLVARRTESWSASIRAPLRFSTVREVGSRKRNQPAPCHVVFEALVQPNRDRRRPWLTLLDDEQTPRVTERHAPDLLVWSSIWTRRPEARLRFELAPDGAGPGAGTDLRWVLLVDEPLPDAPLIGHMRKRANQLINANLRFIFGQ